MQRHIPLGYSVAQGKAQIEPETCQVVQAIYKAYDDGASCNAIAKDLTAKGIWMTCSGGCRTEERNGRKNWGKQIP